MTGVFGDFEGVTGVGGDGGLRRWREFEVGRGMGVTGVGRVTGAEKGSAWVGGTRGHEGATGGGDALGRRGFPGRELSNEIIQS